MAIRFDNIELNYIKNLQEETVITINANQSVLFQSDVTASSGNITAGAVGKASDTVMRVLAGDSNKAGFEAYGNSQGTGYLYVGQSSTYGGGISYNGDNSPSFISGESSDRITFFRRNAGTSSEVFSYSYISDSVYFNGDVTAATGFRTLSGQAIDFVDTNIGYNSIKRDTTNGGLVFNTGGTASLNIFDNGNATFAGDVTVNGGDLTITSASTNSVINLNGGDSFVEKDSGTDLYIANNVSDRDIKFRVKDNGTNVIALTLDGSENGNATFSGDVTVTGDLIVNGTQTILNTQTVEVEDNIIQLNTTQGSPDTATATTSGISIYRGSGVTQASFIFDDADDTWDLTNNLNVAGNVIISNDSTLVIPSHSGFEIEVTGTHAANFRANSTLYLLSQTGSIHLGSGGTNGRLILDTSGDATFAGDVTVNGSHLTLANGTTAAQSTDYLYIGGSNLGSADAAIYIGNSGNGSGYGYRIYYSGIGSGNNNKLIFKSENVGTNVDMLSFTADGNATFAGRTELQKDLRLRGNDASGNLGVVRFLTDANNQLIIDTGNDGSNRTIIDGSGNLTVAGSIKLEGPDGGLVFRNWTASSAYASIATNSMTGSEYALLTDGTNTFLSGGNGGYVSIRGGDNNTAHQLIITATEAKFYGTVIPNSNATQNFGSSSNRWNIGYFSSLRITNVVTNKILKFDGQDIDDSLLGDDGTTVSSGANFIPITDSTYDLGTTTNYWRNLYVDNIISEGGDAEVQKVYKDTVTINNSTYTTIATVSGNSLASGVRLNVTGTSNSVVINVDAKILVNHYKDILIKSTCAYYRKIFIKVVSDNNEDFAIELKRDTAGSTTTTNVNVEIIPLSSETITFTNSHSFTGTTHEHFTEYGEIQSSNDDAGNDYHYWLKDDGAKLKLGAGEDLQIYHDGSNSYINENGTGSLILQTSDLFLRAGGTNNTNNAIVAANGGTVTLYYANAAKLATTSTGVTVTGDTVTTDNFFADTGTSSHRLRSSTTSGILQIRPLGTRTGITPIIQYRHTETGGIKYLMAGSGGTYFGNYNSGIPTDASSMIRLSSNSNNNPSIGIGDSGSGTAHLDIGGNVLITNSGNSYLNGGNFGIGTTTPDEEFSVIGSAGLYGTVSSGIISPASLTFYTSEDGAGLGDSTNANKQKSGEIIWYGKDASLNAAGEYASIESYIIDSNNLIQGSANEGGQIEFNIWRHDVSAEARVKYTALVIDNDADVGIGTTTPTAPLHIEGGTTSEVLKIEADSNPFIRWVENGTNVGFLQFLGDSAYLSNMSNGSLFFRTNNTDKMTITSGGNVGIGTTLPSEKLEITGHLKLTNNGNFIKMVRNSGSAVINVMGFSSGSDTLEIKGGSTGGTAIKFKDTTSDIMVIHNSNVGIGDTSPSQKLDVDGYIQAQDGIVFGNNVSSNTVNGPLIRQYGTYGIQNVIDTKLGGEWTIWHRWGNGGEQAEAVLVDGNGASARMGINKSSMSHNFEVGGTALIDGNTLIGGSGSGNIYVGGQTTGQYFRIHHNNSDTYLDANGGKIYFRGDSGANTRFEMDMTGTNAGKFIAAGDVVAFGSPSDKTLKENIRPIESALDKVNKLEGVEFNWKEQGITNLNEDIGFIAQDVQKILPQLVRENENGKLSLRHQGIVPVLVEAIKELTKEIETLKTQINN